MDKLKPCQYGCGYQLPCSGKMQCVHWSADGRFYQGPLNHKPIGTPERQSMTVKPEVTQEAIQAAKDYLRGRANLARIVEEAESDEA